jgi:hypothetical protein
MTFYILYLANVHGNIDNYVPVAISDDYQKLLEWEREQRAEAPYSSEEEHSDAFGQVHGYTLAYKKGSPIQWFNPPNGIYGGGIKKEDGTFFDVENWLRFNTQVTRI